MGAVNALTRLYVCTSSPDPLLQSSKYLADSFIYFTASVVGRAKRFLTPTTYPIPTTFMVPTTMGKDNDQMLGSLVANSRPINCPVKRDTRAKRVYLDSSMMREIYLRNVGVWNSRFVAETQSEAKENFVDILEFRNHTQVRYVFSSVLKRLDL